MVWVGGGILIHGAEEFGVTAPGRVMHAAEHAAGFLGGAAAMQARLTTAMANFTASKMAGGSDAAGKLAGIVQRLDEMADETEKGWSGQIDGSGFIFERTLRGVRHVVTLDEARQMDWAYVMATVQDNQHGFARFARVVFTTFFSTALLSTTFFSTALLSSTFFSTTLLSTTFFSGTFLSATFFGRTFLSTTLFSGTFFSGTFFSASFLKCEMHLS